MTLAFGAYTLDGDRRELLKGAHAVHLSPKAYALLVLLLERRPAAVAKAEIHERLWSGTFVADVTLASVVAEVRAALGESARQARLIRTAHSFGYAFAGQAVASDAGDAGVGPACWLSSSARQITLQQGANLLGRDRTAGIWLDSASVSRRHARIDLVGGAATLVDLGSKNGTFLNGARVAGPAAVTDGDELRIGSVALVFRNSLAPGSTKTAGT